MKRNFINYRKNGKKGGNFWDNEYKKEGFLAISDDPSEDMIKFTNWLKREYGYNQLNATMSVLDLGCGNGRNLLYLAKTYGSRGLGYDISGEAVKQARKKSEAWQLTYETHSIAQPLPAADKSQIIVLDMMTSHFLKREERENLIKEIDRVLRPDGFFFLKTFLLDEDINAKRLLKERPAEEKGSYIHPHIGVAEHVSTEDEIIELLSPHFFIHKILKSHRHRSKGQAFKRRSVCIYAQKKD